MRTDKFLEYDTCMRSYKDISLYNRHRANCGGIERYQNEEIPNPAILKFHDHPKTCDAALVMYTDIEAILEKQDDILQTTITNTIRTHRHKAVA